MRRPVAVQTQRPPRHHAQHRAWLQAVISRTCDSSRTKRERPLVLSRTLFDGRSISEESMAVLLLWASLWASKHVTVSFDSTCGFGLRATTDRRARGCRPRARVLRTRPRGERLRSAVWWKHARSSGAGERSVFEVRKRPLPAELLGCLAARVQSSDSQHTGCLS